MIVPNISWRCSTYGRTRDLKKIIQYYLEQDYRGTKEFVILNDDPDVEYICKHKEIRIYNWKYRFKNLRKKQNICTSLCHGKIFQPVADDDEYKPWAISRFVEEIKDDPFVACRGFWKKTGTNMLWKPEAIAGLYMCRKDFWESMGCYREWEYRTKDMTDDVSYHLHPEDFVHRIRTLGNHYKEFKLNKNEAFFVWNRLGDRSIWEMGDKEKFIKKERTPTKIKIET